jgi:hypothetical protein
MRREDDAAVRNPRLEAAERIGGARDVRVLEPSPPGVDEPPFFADDPVAGGEVAPVARAGARTWADVCDESGDPGLRAWCEERWLVRGPLGPLPPDFAVTRVSLHALAERIVAPARHAANGKIGLRYTYRGFGTPFFGDRQVRVEDGDLIATDTMLGDRRLRPATLRQAADLVGVPVGAETGVYKPTTPDDPDAPLTIDAVAARAVGDWFGFCASLLEQLRAEAEPDADKPARVQLWPEHFDLAVDLGPDGARANFGGSPGDDAHPEPYLYIGPWEPREGAFWNESFGASLPYSAILGGADAMEFLRHGKELLGR